MCYNFKNDLGRGGLLYKKTLHVVCCLLLVACLLGCAMVLAGCNQREKKLVGKWKLAYGDTVNENMMLCEDGTCYIGNEAGTWKVQDNQLIISGGYSGKFMNFDNYVAEYSLQNENNLRIEFRKGILYERVSD